jgi:hypothetical protein
MGEKMDSLEEMNRKSDNYLKKEMKRLDNIVKKDDKWLKGFLKTEKGRANFSQAVKKKELNLAKRKCRKCHEPLREHGFEFHHRDFDKTNKSQNNCRVLCCTCHSIITAKHIKIP